MHPDELIFVYNADSGLVNGLLDLLHKNLRPETYACNLCAVTYNNSGMKKEWKTFVQSIPLPVTFLHKDEFVKRFATEAFEAPSAYWMRGAMRELIISANTMQELPSLDALMQLTKAILNKEGIILQDYLS